MSEYNDIAATEELERDLTWFTQSFVLYPETLMNLSLPITLSWQRLQFVPSNNDRVSKKRGLYAFVVQHDDSNLPLHGYITYIGITGRHSSERNLQSRYEEYLREQRRPKRRHIYRMLNKWKDCIYFHFAAVEDEDVDLAEFERRLNDALIPPYSTKDFSVDIRQAKGVWHVS